MGQAIGDLLPLAIGIALSPVAITAVILMLITPRPIGNGLAFLAGWLAGLTIVAVVVLVIADAVGLSTSAGPSHTVSAAKLALGLVFLALAVRQWRRRPKPGEVPPLPRWMRALDRFTPGKAAGIAAVLSGLGPKSIILVAAAAAGIAQAGLPGGDQAVSAAVLVVVGSLAIIAPLVVYVAAGERAAGTLDGWKTWLVTHDAAVMVALFLVFGFVLIGKGIAGLS